MNINSKVYGFAMLVASATTLLGAQVDTAVKASSDALNSPAGERIALIIVVVLFLSAIILALNGNERLGIKGLAGPFKELATAATKIAANEPQHMALLDKVCDAFTKVDATLEKLPGAMKEAVREVVKEQVEDALEKMRAKITEERAERTTQMIADIARRMPSQPMIAADDIPPQSEPTLVSKRASVLPTSTPIPPEPR